jgi:hypothetical protein
VHIVGIFHPHNLVLIRKIYLWDKKKNAFEVTMPVPENISTPAMPGLVNELLKFHFCKIWKWNLTWQCDFRSAKKITLRFGCFSFKLQGRGSNPRFLGERQTSVPVESLHLSIIPHSLPYY